MANIEQSVEAVLNRLDEIDYFDRFKIHFLSLRDSKDFHVVFLMHEDMPLFELNTHCNLHYIYAIYNFQLL